MPEGCVEGWSDTDRATWTSTKLLDGKWHHLAICFDPSGEGAVVTAYFDYRQVCSSTFPTYYVKEGQTKLHFWLARDNSNSGLSQVHVGWRLRQAFDGKMDEIRVSYGALGSSEFLRQVNGLLIIVM